MVPDGIKSDQVPDQRFWEILKHLVAPDVDERAQALDELREVEGYQKEPLVIFLLATRLTDPDLEIRHQAVNLVGELLSNNDSQYMLDDLSLKYVVGHLSGFGKAQYIRLLEVSAAYLSSEDAVSNILKVCSYAGKALSGILNDRKQSVQIRQQAIFYCGEVGFLSTIVALRNLIQRVEKSRSRTEAGLDSKAYRDQEELYMYAVSALGKLEA